MLHIGVNDNQVKAIYFRETPSVIFITSDEEIGIKLKAGIGRGKNAEDAAYMADIGLEEIRAHNNEMWTWVIEKEY